MQRVSNLSKILIISLLALVLSLISQSSPILAGFNTWTSIGPAGGWIYALAIDPTAPNTLYAGTFGGGVFKSTDGGANWKRSQHGPDPPLC